MDGAMFLADVPPYALDPAAKERFLVQRLAELTDVVQELLLPVAQRDEQRVAELMEKYSRGL